MPANPSLVENLGFLREKPQRTAKNRPWRCFCPPLPLPRLLWLFFAQNALVCPKPHGYGLLLRHTAPFMHGFPIYGSFRAFGRILPRFAVFAPVSGRFSPRMPLLALCAVFLPFLRSFGPSRPVFPRFRLFWRFGQHLPRFCILPAFFAFDECFAPQSSATA